MKIINTGIFEIIKQVEEQRKEYERKYGHLNSQFIWMLSDEIKNIFQLNIDSIICKSGLLKMIEEYSKNNNLSVGIEELDYVINKLIKDGYLQEIQDYEEIFSSFKYCNTLIDNDYIYKIGDEYKIYLQKHIEKEKNKLLKEIGNKISKYTVDFKLTLDKALKEIKIFMMSKND